MKNTVTNRIADHKPAECPKVRAVLRRCILADSQMNRDAVRIKRASLKLLEMLREFWSEHDSGVATTLWLQNGGLTHEELHEMTDAAKQGLRWGDRLCNDVAGFRWALETFIKQFGASVLPLNAHDEITRDLLERLDNGTL